METGNLSLLDALLDAFIDALIAGKEGDRAEFKQTTGQLERGMETLCAFLNGEGGTVLFGVADNGKIVGQEVSDKTKREIAEAIGRLEPAATVQVSYLPLSGSEKKIITLHVEEARKQRPFTYRNRPYMRVESTTVAMPQQQYKELLFNRDDVRHCWEQFDDPELTLNDIDENEVLKTVRLGINCGRLPENTGNDIPVILEKFGLMRKGMLNHAAAILFANREMPGSYPQCLLRLARFRGTNRMEFLDSRRIHGNIFQLLDAAMAFLFKHLSLSGRIEGLEREEHLTVPYKAVREGVLNALAHRSYREAGGSVGIAIYDDRVEVENPGSFPYGWDVEKMASEHCSEPQNPIIANVLYKRKLLENWGRGISLMEEECRKAGLPTPEYRLGGGYVVLVFHYAQKAVGEHTTATQQSPNSQPTAAPQPPHSHATATPQSPNSCPTATPQSPNSCPTATPQSPHSDPTATQQLPHSHATATQQLPHSHSTAVPLSPHSQPTAAPQVPNSHPTVPPQVCKLIAALSDGAHSPGELMGTIGLKDKGHFLARYLKVAIGLELVEAVYPDLPKQSPRQKYRLTRQGTTLLNENKELFPIS